MAQDQQFKKVTAHCKEYGFVFPSSEIYDGMGAVYDYGPNGIELKNNLQQYWWKAMVQMNNNIVGLDAAIFMHPKTWKASGHVDAFNDPLIDNKDSKKRYRADVLIEDHIQKIEQKIEKECTKALKRFGDSFDREQYVTTNPRVMGYREKIDKINNTMKTALENNDLEGLRDLIIECDITDPDTGSRNWTDVKQFNLMFSTQVGAVAGDSGTVYLRPETAQGIFVNYLNVQQSSRQKLPFGIAQVGKSFRNEIIARQFIFRTREFTQMEMQFFVQPGNEMEWYEKWKADRMKWHSALFDENKLRYHDHLKPAHYANAACDIEYEMPFGFKEIEGIHSRTDFDLNQHQEHSGKKLQYFDPEKQTSYTPYVVETAIGLDRLFLATMCESLKEEQLEDGSSRTVLKLHPTLAPLKVAVLPLVKKDGLPEKAQAIVDELKMEVNCFYEEKDTIGKRYRRQDAIGTPFCVTVDNETASDGSVTLRDRDTMQQERISVDKLMQVVREKTSWKNLL